MRHLNEVEQDRLKNKRRTDHFVDSTITELDRILASPRFLRCRENARGMLDYVVKMHILEQPIKEMLIARDVFGHEVNSGAVRECAGNLRDRLTDYYQNEGKEDPIRITIPLGSYLPLFVDTRKPVLISTFENWSASPDQSHLCEVVTDELLYLVGRNQRFAPREVSTLAGKTEQAHYGIRGALVCCGQQEVHLCYCVLDLREEEVAVTHLSGRREDLLKLAARAAKAILAKLDDSTRDRRDES